MGIKFLSRLTEARDELFVVARGQDRPNIIAETTGFLEAEGLYVASIAFNLTSPEQDQFAMDVVARGPQRALEKCAIAFDSDLPLPGLTGSSVAWPKIRWPRASMFHIGLNTPDRAGIVAAISRIVGMPQGQNGGRHASEAGTFVHLLGAIDNSGDSAQGGTPYFNLRANVATATRKVGDMIAEELRATRNELGFGDDLWIIPLDQPANQR